METCRTCRWWDKDNRSNHWVGKNPERMCRLSEDGQDIKRLPGEPDPLLMYSCDASGYHSYLMVNPDFGCIHHAPVVDERVCGQGAASESR